MGQAHAVANLVVLLFPIVGSVMVAIAMGTAMVNPTGSARIALALYVAGFALFVWAKLSVIRSGRFFTFGSSQMRPAHRVLYRAGYVLMAGGLVSTVALVLAGR